MTAKPDAAQGAVAPLGWIRSYAPKHISEGGYTTVDPDPLDETDIPVYTHPQAAPAQGGGWKLVPVEPTAEMIEACCEAHARVPWPHEYDPKAQQIRRDSARRGYAAMLTAAPSQPDG